MYEILETAISLSLFHLVKAPQMEGLKVKADISLEGNSTRELFYAHYSERVLASE